MGFNYWLLIVDVAIIALLAFGSVLFVNYYQHPIDKGAAIYHKIIAMVCFTVAMFVPLLFPTDIANTLTGGAIKFMGGLFAWIPWVIMILAFVVIPFSYSLYSTPDSKDNICKRVCKSFWKAILVIIILLALGIIFYFIMGFAQIPMVTRVSPMVDGQSLLWQDHTTIATSGLREFQMSIPIYLMSFVAFIGYIFLLVFIGVGMATLPLSLIRKFRSRPRPIREEEFFKRRLELRNKATELRQIALSLEGGSGRKHRNAIAHLDRAVGDMEREHFILLACRGEGKYNPIPYYAGLLLAVILIPLSCVLVAHIIVWPLLHVHPLLNWALDWLANVWSLLAVIVFGILALYLMMCTLSGISYFGFRFIMFIPVHPMRKGATLLNGILFNMALLLLASLAILPFLQELFSMAADGGGSSLIFAQTVNMKYLRYVFQYGLWVPVAVFPLSFIITLCLPTETVEKRAKRQAESQKPKRVPAAPPLYNPARVSDSSDP